MAVSGSKLEPSADSPERAAALDGRLASETRPFFVTSEFWLIAITLAALWVYTAVSDDVGSRLAWTLTTALASAYMLARGLAKAGTGHLGPDPREAGSRR